MGQYDELLKMLQTYSSGQASVNQGLINFQNAEKGAKTNQIINDGINTGLTAGMQYFQGMNNPSLN